MIGMLIASPLFSEMVHRVNAMRVLGWGMGIWMLAVLGSGLSWNYPSLVVFRSFVGFGEAAVVALSPPFIGRYQKALNKHSYHCEGVVVDFLQMKSLFHTCGHCTLPTLKSDRGNIGPCVVESHVVIWVKHNELLIIWQVTVSCMLCIPAYECVLKCSLFL